MDDVAEKKAYLETRLNAKHRDRLNEFLDRGLQLAAGEMLAKTTVNSMAERNMGRAAVQTHLARGLIGLGIAPGERCRHDDKVARHHRLAVDPIGFCANAVGRDRGIGTQQLFDRDDILLGRVGPDRLLVPGMGGEVVEMQSEVRGDGVEPAEIKVEAVAKNFLVGSLRPSTSASAPD